jgi:DDE superfamily endonuclease
VQVQRSKTSIKKIQTKVQALRFEHPNKEVEVWAEDEGRIGLKPITRRVWAKRGLRPIAIQKRGFKWLHVYAFIHPKTGQNHFWLFSHVDLECMKVALAEFKQTLDPENQKIIVLLLDNAGWHRSVNLEIPEGLILEFIPPYTPELSPAEGVMPLLHEAVANECFETLEQVQVSLDERCVFLMQNPEVVRGRCGFAWACG